MKTSFLKTITALACLAAGAVLSPCSYCWPSLHTAEAVLHCDKQVVVVLLPQQPPTVKYRYKGKDYYPIQLAYAIDKGKDIYRRGEGSAWCWQDTSTRFDVQQQTVRNYLCRASEADSKVGLYAERLIPEKDFPFAHAKRVVLRGENNRGGAPFCRTCYPYYEEVRGEVGGMPITQQAEEPATWRHIVAVPLEAVDITATVTMRTAETAGIIALLPVSAVWNIIAKIFNG